MKEWSVEWLLKVAYEHDLTICFVPLKESPIIPCPHHSTDRNGFVRGGGL